jgi:hypothetical protein
VNEEEDDEDATTTFDTAEVEIVEAADEDVNAPGKAMVVVTTVYDEDEEAGYPTTLVKTTEENVGVTVEEEEVT